MTTQVNGEWFHEKLKDSNKSLRGLAKHMGLDPSAVSRTFSGERRMQMDEPPQIAQFLGVPVADVMKNAGVEPRGGMVEEILLSYIVDEDGRMTPIENPEPLQKWVFDKVQMTMGLVDAKLSAAQVRAETGPLSIWDDAIVLFHHAGSIEPTAMGALSICELRDGSLIMGKVDRARKTGEARIVSPSGDIAEPMLVSATAVLAVIP